MTAIATRMIPAKALDEDFRRLGESESSVQLAMQELADWCIRNQHLIEQGRKHGFRLGTTPMVKDIIALACSTPGEAARLTANIQDVPQ
ncbi:hypothetical protein Rfer_4432 (plasmid) [Rhodoferax ferrireducens T118]|uniref:Uncharacterized protein n=1 Tax=Albidiferax ferrireducens (strain ATCC BAA-621 / DSM 15236 / T118) TaxID=338969 RepID=Q21Q27_ALBFT|nr:hypothetical protein [Rhodoferax ferrireducens]ABD72118.1 hypothetical protein Rfer_4432 [Rhodoferax ferrireducens T118]